MKEFNCLTDCPDQGFCCREFYLHFQGRNLGHHQIKATKEEITQLVIDMGLPYVATYYDRLMEAWAFTCPKLGHDGLCAIHNERPDICRNFKPKSNRSLCCARSTFFEALQKFGQIWGKIMLFSR